MSKTTSILIRIFVFIAIYAFFWAIFNLLQARIIAPNSTSLLWRMVDCIIIILGLLTFAVVSGACGWMVLSFIDYAFEQITGYWRTGTSQAQLEQNIEEINNSKIVFELKQLLIERRMGQWWKFLVWLIISSVTYAVMFLRTFYS